MNSNNTSKQTLTELSHMQFLQVRILGDAGKQTNGLFGRQKLQAKVNQL